MSLLNFVVYTYVDLVHYRFNVVRKFDILTENTRTADSSTGKKVRLHQVPKQNCATFPPVRQFMDYQRVINV